MNKIVSPLSFNGRRAPAIKKVVRDADIMYDNARYVIVLDAIGNVMEQRFNRRFDDQVVDCLAVFAPCDYQGTVLERALVLEIGLRRFVPYAQTEHKLGAPTRRGPTLRFRKGEERKPRPKIERKKRAYQIPKRLPIARLTDDTLFDILPVLTRGIQECVDSIVRTWTGTSTNIRWAQAGNRAHRIWMKHQMGHTISVRIPKDMELLCAAATFAEMAWRTSPEGNITAAANAVKDMLKSYLRPREQAGEVVQKNFSDEFVRERTMFAWVASRLKTKMERGYSEPMVQGLFDAIGPSGSTARKLVEQICRVHKVPLPPKDKLFQRYQSTYGEMKDLLLERWLIKTNRSLQALKKKKKYLEERTSEKPYTPQAENSCVFEVFASKEAEQDMVENYCSARASVVPVDTVAHLQSKATAQPEDDDIPWDTGPVKKTGTDDKKIPF